LPRAPPSTWTITFIARGRLRSGDRRPARAASGPREREHVAGDACPAAVAHDPPLGARGRLAAVARTAVELATLDDHAHALIVLVALGEPLQELAGEGLGYDAVDHLAGDLTRRARVRKPRKRRGSGRGRGDQSDSVPADEAWALAWRSSRGSWESSVPCAIARAVGGCSARSTS